MQVTALQIKILDVSRWLSSNLGVRPSRRSPAQENIFICIRRGHDKETSHPTRLQFQMGYDMSQVRVAEMKGKEWVMAYLNGFYLAFDPCPRRGEFQGCSWDRIGWEMNSFLGRCPPVRM